MTYRHYSCSPLRTSADLTLDRQPITDPCCQSLRAAQAGFASEAGPFARHCGNV